MFGLTEVYNNIKAHSEYVTKRFSKYKIREFYTFNDIPITVSLDKETGLVLSITIRKGD